MKKYVFLALVLLFNAAKSQNDSTCASTAIGIELDALPYITGGYYGSVWVGHNHMRYRAVLTHLTTPQFAVADGFTNNKIMAYTVIADYFFKPGFEGWWVGAGLEYWKCEIQSDAKLSTAKYNNTILTAGGGYVWKFYDNFFLNPWAAVHLRIAGDTSVMVDGREFKPPLTAAEVSLKLGWYFSL